MANIINNKKEDLSLTRLVIVIEIYSNNLVFSCNLSILDLICASEVSKRLR